MDLKPGDRVRWNSPNLIDLKLDDKVQWTSQNGLPAGEGKVKGLASVPLAVLGRNVIIEVDDPVILQQLRDGGYPFTHITQFEVHLTKVKA